MNFDIFFPASPLSKYFKSTCQDLAGNFLLNETNKTPLPKGEKSNKSKIFEEVRSIIQNLMLEETKIMNDIVNKTLKT